MHNIKYKLLFAVILSVTALSASHQNANAQVPDIEVRVLHGVTNIPLKGIVISQTNSPDFFDYVNGGRCMYSPPAQSTRYEPTNSEGVALLSGRYYENDQSWKYTTLLDIDGDSVNDTTYNTYVNGTLSTTGQPCRNVADFGCGQNPHTIKVVMPKGWTGYFTPMKPLNSNNQPNDGINATGGDTIDSKTGDFAITFNNIASKIVLETKYYPINSSPPQPPKSDWCDPNCATKKLGTMDMSSFKFSPVTSVEEQKEYYVQLTVNNQSPGQRQFTDQTLGKVVLKEQVSTTNFQEMLNPASSDNLVIKRRRANTSFDEVVTDAVCPVSNGNRTCISNPVSYKQGFGIIGYTLTLNSVNANDTYNIYFKVKTKTFTLDELGIKMVNNDIESNINYVDKNKVMPIRNYQINATKKSNNQNCIGTSDCTEKVTGTYVGVLNSFSASDQLDTKKDWYVRLRVTGRNAADNTPAQISITEKLNAEYLQIEPLTTANVRITKSTVNNVSSEVEATQTICGNNLSCMNIANGVLQAQLGPLDRNSVVNLYFKVQPIKTTPPGSSVLVNDESVSKVKYTTNDTVSEVVINNYQIDIINEAQQPTESTETLQALIEVKGGDVFSAGSPSSIKFDFNSSEQKLITTNGGIPFAAQEIDLKSGETTPGKWNVIDYPAPPPPVAYDTKYTEYQSRLTTKNLNGITDFSPGNIAYIDTNVANNSQRDYRIHGGGWNGQRLSGTNAEPKHPVVFVPGDLYVEVPFTIAANGVSSLTFYVNGNMGVDPSITNIQGNYFVNGKIDTACDRSKGFSNGNCQTSEAVDRQLVLEGIFYSNGGFNLDRRVAGSPSEVFVYRPDMIIGMSQGYGKSLFSWRECETNCAAVDP